MGILIVIDCLQVEFIEVLRGQISAAADGSTMHNHNMVTFPCCLTAYGSSINTWCRPVTYGKHIHDCGPCATAGGYRPLPSRGYYVSAIDYYSSLSSLYALSISHLIVGSNHC